MKQAFQRLRKSINATFNKIQYETMLESLRSRDGNLRALGSQWNQLYSPCLDMTISKLALPSTYTAVQRASQKS
jgi:hypothetical protein